LRRNFLAPSPEAMRGKAELRGGIFVGKVFFEYWRMTWRN